MSDSEKMIAQMAIQIQQLTTEVARLASIVSGLPIRAEGWATPQKAAAALQQEGIRNARHLQRLRLEGAFSEVKGEIRDVSKGDRPTWEYHVSKCRSALRRHFRDRSAS